MDGHVAGTRRQEHRQVLDIGGTEQDLGRAAGTKPHQVLAAAHRA